jgi:hypothetical protein
LYLRGIDIEDCEGTHDARTTSKKKKNGEILRLWMNQGEKKDTTHPK